MCCPCLPPAEWTGDVLSLAPLGPPERNLLVESAADGQPVAGVRHCPGAYARSLAATDAAKAWRWWEKGQLALVYPGGLPAVIAEAVELAGNVKAEWEAEGRRRLEIDAARKRGEK